MKTVLYGIALALAASTAVIAQDRGGVRTPELDGPAGAMALAAVVAMGLILYNRYNKKR